MIIVEIQMRVYDTKAPRVDLRRVMTYNLAVMCSGARITGKEILCHTAALDAQKFWDDMVLMGVMENGL